jgi:hypothetical protein
MIRTLVCVCVLVGLPAVARPQLPEPLDPAVFDFPGSVPAPSGAATAGVALADRWIGDEPAGNPAVPPRNAVALSPALVRVSRQDLAADNRHFEQQAAFFDVAGASISVGLRRVGVHLYVEQPVLRLESQRFQRGQVAGVGAPALFRSDVEAREIRGGVAGALALGPATKGVDAPRRCLRDGRAVGSPRRRHAPGAVLR